MMETIKMSDGFMLFNCVDDREVIVKVKSISQLCTKKSKGVDGTMFYIFLEHGESYTITQESYDGIKDVLLSIPLFRIEE